MSLSQDNDMEGFSSRRAIGIEKESKRQRGFYHATASAGSRGDRRRKEKPTAFRPTAVGFVVPGTGANKCLPQCAVASLIV